MNERMLPTRRDFIADAAVAGLGLVMPQFMSSPTNALSMHTATPLSSLRTATTWLNTAPLDESQLRGKVVLVNFCTYTCINWLRSLPYVRAWAAAYRERGLVVIGVHTPEFRFERDIANVRPALNEMRVEYPIAVDNDYNIWNAFSNRYWPATYLIDAKGKTRLRKFGEGGYDEIESMIRKLLSVAGDDAEGRERAVPVARGAEIPADWANLSSPENYLGAGRTENFVPSRANSQSSRGGYVIPTRMQLNEWALDGGWELGTNAAMLRSPNGRIVCRFRARDLHLVMTPAARDAAVPFRVRLDRNAPHAARGVDIDERGEGLLKEPRLYQLIRQRPPIMEREFAIEFPAGGVDAYAFTFG